MRQELAEDIARDALIWLAGSDDLLPVFLNATGATVDAVRNGVEDPVFLGSVLDFLLMDDAWIARFSDETRHAPNAPGLARAALPGGDAVHWT